MQLSLFDPPPKLELKKEQNAHQLTKQDKEKVEAERDEWKDKAQKRFWAIVAMVLCAVLYVVFKILAWRAARVQPV